MGVATGSITHTTTHPLTRRTVYHGPLVQLVEAMVGVAHGGQIITDSSTVSAMSPNLNEIAHRVPTHPDYDAMMTRPRWSSRFCKHCRQHGQNHISIKTSTVMNTKDNTDSHDVIMA